MTHLDAHVVVRRPGHLLDVRLQAEPGDVVAVIGPNGAGKSTLLGALAGTVALSDGHVRCRGRLWTEGGRPAVVTQERNIGMVFQQRLLFPHLTVLRNVAFGPRSRGASRKEADVLARDWLRRLGV